MGNPDDYWRFLAQAILQGAQSSSAQATQVAQMNMALEDQRMKAEQYKQDLELRRQQLEQSKAESQARIAEAQSAQDVNKLRLKEATSDYNQKEADRFVADVSMTPEDRVNLARAPLDKLAADKAEAESRNRMYAAQAGKAEFDLQNAPAAFQSEQDVRNAQIEDIRTRNELARNEDARKAQLHNYQIEDAKYNSGVNKAKWDRQIQEWAYADLHRGLSPAEDAQLSAHVASTMYPHIISFTQNMMAMGKKDPEIRAALDFVNDISKTAIQAKAIEVMDPVIGGKLKGNLEALAGQNLDPYEKYKQQKAMIAGAREEMKAKAESQPIGPDSKPSDKIDLTNNGPVDVLASVYDSEKVAARQAKRKIDNFAYDLVSSDIASGSKATISKYRDAFIKANGLPSDSVVPASTLRSWASREMSKMVSDEDLLLHDNLVRGKFFDRMRNVIPFNTTDPIRVPNALGSENQRIRLQTKDTTNALGNENQRLTMQSIRDASNREMNDPETKSRWQALFDAYDDSNIVDDPVSRKTIVRAFQMADDSFMEDDPETRQKVQSIFDDATDAETEVSARGQRNIARLLEQDDEDGRAAAAAFTKLIDDYDRAKEGSSLKNVLKRTLQGILGRINKVSQPRTSSRPIYR